MTVIAPLRVHQTTSTIGSGTLSLTAAGGSFRNFNAPYSTGNKVPYCVTDSTSNYEIGVGTLTTGSPDTISRDTIILSSNSNSAVSFGSGTKQVFAWEIGNSIYPSTFSSTTTATLSDWGTTFLFTGSSTTVFNLPALSTVPKGYTISIKNSGTATITTTPNGSDAIEGLSGGVTVSQTPQTSATYTTDGTVWRQIYIGVNWPVSVGNGGTGITSGTSGGVPYFSGTTSIASSAALAANFFVVGGGAGVAPSTQTYFSISGATFQGASGSALAIGGLSNEGAGSVNALSYFINNISLAQNANYNILYDGASNESVFLGYSGDATNYYRQTTHQLQSIGGGTTFATLNSSGLALTTPLAVSSGGTGLATANANLVFGGPSSGSAAAPSFRSLVNSDLPGSNQATIYAALSGV